MNEAIYRYTLPPEAEIDDAEASLLLAVWGTESLHGEVRVRLDAAHLFDRERRACVIDARTPAGRTLNDLFAGYLRKEFGETVAVERVAALFLENPVTPSGPNWREGDR